MADTPALSVRKLAVHFRDQVELARCYLSSPAHGGLTVMAPYSIRNGEYVQLRVRLLSHAREELLDGMVIWCRQIKGQQVQTGIAFFENQQEKIEHLMSLEIPKFPQSQERREKRMPANLTVTYQTDSDFSVSKTANISKGGFFIQSQTLPPEGCDILFRLHPSEVEESIDITGQVAWSKAGIGFGVKFIDVAEKECTRFAQLISRLDKE
ncbi:MAG: PilZ domain-containing protein [Deltaproteobacteria bacterium]|nr:PilZ domain-containing protein [Deltaproteobacteria bacterium]